MRSRSSLPAVISIDASDASLQSIPGADRLCHFLSWAAPAAPPPASDVEGAYETQSAEHDDGAESESGSGERSADEGVYSGVRDHRSENKGFESWSISVETISHWSTGRPARFVLCEAQNLSGVALYPLLGSTRSQKRPVPRRPCRRYSRGVIPHAALTCS